MKTATIQELKQELQGISPSKLMELCLRLARFKKENKELLTYLLFEAHDETAYITGVKTLIAGDFAELPKASIYLTKKSLRKTLRAVNKYIRYSGSKETELVLLLYFCRQLKDSGIPFQKTAVLVNLYQSQLKKIQTALKTLHEDLQHDYKQALNGL